MREIQLTQGYVALVDDVDFERVSQLKWFAHVKRHGVYAEHNEGTRPQRKTRSMHRFILGVTNPKIEVDHKDLDGLNNQRYNLRKAGGQNQHNVGLRKDNTSGFKGVSWNKWREKWQAYIAYKGKRIHLGYFTDPLEAACAYDMAAVKYFGEFAHCNFSTPN